MASAVDGAPAEAPGETITEEHDDADVMFARMMIPHHEQAVEMSEVLLDKDGIPEDVRDFAQGVVDAQGPEIERMNAMLTARGGTAARLHLEQMIVHHEGATDMARDEVANGRNPQARELAGTIAEDQEAEIQQIERMLQELPSGS